MEFPRFWWPETSLCGTAKFLRFVYLMYNTLLVTRFFKGGNPMENESEVW